MLRIRVNSYKYIRECSCLQAKYKRYIISIKHNYILLSIYIYTVYIFCLCTNNCRFRYMDIFFFVFFFLVIFSLLGCGRQYLPRKLFIVDSLTVKAFPFSSFSAMRRFNSSSPGMQTTAIRLKSLKPFILRRWAEAYAFVYKNITVVVVGWLIGWLVV